MYLNIYLSLAREILASQTVILDDNNTHLDAFA